jgi:hypothetical protein
MIELLKKSLAAQYEAAFCMLNRCLEACPDEQWHGQVGNLAFWHVVYHTLYYTDLYLSRDEAAFRAPPFHRENYHLFGKTPWPPHEEVISDIPYDRAALCEYLAHCRRKAAESIAAESAESLAGPSGFWWYKIPRAEFHLNNIRHVQHHAAQMSLYLRKSAGAAIDWVGSGWRENQPSEG